MQSRNADDSDGAERDGAVLLREPPEHDRPVHGAAEEGADMHADQARKSEEVHVIEVPHDRDGRFTGSLFFFLLKSIYT